MLPVDPPNMSDGAYIQALEKDIEYKEQKIKRLWEENVLLTASNNGLRMPQVGWKTGMTLDEAETEIERLNGLIWNKRLQTLIDAMPNAEQFRLLVSWINDPRMQAAFPDMDWEDDQIQNDLMVAAMAIEKEKPSGATHEPTS